MVGAGGDTEKEKKRKSERELDRCLLLLQYSFQSGGKTQSALLVSLLNSLPCSLERRSSVDMKLLMVKKGSQGVRVLARKLCALVGSRKWRISCLDSTSPPLG